MPWVTREAHTESYEKYAYPRYRALLVHVEVCEFYWKSKCHKRWRFAGAAAWMCGLSLEWTGCDWGQPARFCACWILALLSDGMSPLKEWAQELSAYCIVREDPRQWQTLGAPFSVLKAERKHFPPRTMSHWSPPCCLLRCLAVLALGSQGLGLKEIVGFYFSIYFLF